MKKPHMVCRYRISLRARVTMAELLMQSFRSEPQAHSICSFYISPLIRNDWGLNCAGHRGRHNLGNLGTSFPPAIRTPGASRSNGVNLALDVTGRDPYPSAEFGALLKATAYGDNTAQPLTFPRNSALISALRRQPIRVPPSFKFQKIRLQNSQNLQLLPFHFTHSLRSRRDGPYGVTVTWAQ